MNTKLYSKSKMLIVILIILYYIVYNVVKKSIHFKFRSETFDRN